MRGGGGDTHAHIDKTLDTFTFPKRRGFYRIPINSSGHIFVGQIYVIGVTDNGTCTFCTSSFFCVAVACTYLGKIFPKNLLQLAYSTGRICAQSCMTIGSNGSASGYRLFIPSVFFCSSIFRVTETSTSKIICTLQQLVTFVQTVSFCLVNEK